VEGLKKTEQMFEDILNGITEPVLILSKDLKVLWANKAFQSQTGYEIEEIIGSYCYKLTHHRERPCQLPHDLCPISESEKIGSTVTTTHTHFDKYGGQIFVEVSAYPVKDKEGEITQFVCMYRDITDMKRVEEALQKSLDGSKKTQAEISAFLEGARAVIESHTFHDAARSIFNACKNVTGAVAGYIALLSEDGTHNEVVFLDSGDLPCTVDPNLPMPIRGLRERVFRTGKAVYNNDFSRSKFVRFMPEGHVSLDNVLFAPMLIKDKVAGLLGLSNKPGGFTEEDVRKASGFGELAAFALLNKRAEDVLRRRHDELEVRVEERTKDLAKSNRALRMLNECNEMMVRAKDETDLLQNICRIIVDVGGYRMVWVGMAKDDERKTVRPVVHRGFEEGYLETLNVTYADTERGHGPTGTAIRTGKPSVARNILTDPNFAPWRAEASRRGYESSIAIPLVADGGTLGALNVYSAKPDAFDANEVDLLKNLADDVAFALIALRMRVARKLVEDEMRKSREELRDLYAHLQSVREEERKGISREIHDELGQALTALKFDVSSLANKIYPDHKPLRKKTTSMIKQIDETIQIVKRICSELRPTVLDHFGLPAAIEYQAEKFQNRAGIKCKVDLDSKDMVFDKDLSTTFFRILQETLTNIARHAKATHVRISLKEKEGLLVMEVSDNGKGVTKRQLSGSKSFGLMGIKERVHHWGGEVDIRGIRNRGTTVTVSIPLKKEGRRP